MGIIQKKKSKAIEVRTRSSRARMELVECVIFDHTMSRGSGASLVVNWKGVEAWTVWAAICYEKLLRTRRGPRGRGRMTYCAGHILKCDEGRICGFQFRGSPSPSH